MVMKTLVLRRLIPVVAIALALSSQGVAQSSPEQKLGGLIHHYTAALDANGPWHISGEWSVRVKGDSGRADFSAALSMVRSDNAARQPHTHHVTIVDGEVVRTATGFAISGDGAVTLNGNVVFTSPVEVQVTGGNTIQYSNVSVRFTSGMGLNHFGAEALGGAVSR
jgi:hypothetical protein